MTASSAHGQSLNLALSALNAFFDSCDEVLSAGKALVLRLDRNFNPLLTGHQSSPPRISHGQLSALLES